jgi:ribosomal-protein-alanine N-acetyltransferase
MNEPLLAARTARLMLRAFEPGDVAAIERLFGDPVVMRYVGAGGALPPEAARRALERWSTDARTRDHSIWALVEHSGSDVIGWCGLQNLPASDKVEVAWLLDRPYWGRGYATEAARAALTIGFERAGLREIVAIAHHENAASLNVMRKLGMQPGGTVRYFERDMALFSIGADAFIAGEDIETFSAT